MSPISPRPARIAQFDAAAKRLAEAFWPGPLTLVLPKAAGCRRRGARHRRPRHHCGARARASGRACNSWRRSASRWSRRRPTARATSRRPPPHMCERSRRPHRSDRRRRADAGRRGIRPSSPASTSPCCCGPAAAARGDRARCSAARSPTLPARRPATARSRSRRACSPRTTRRARGCGSTPTHVEPGEALLAFGPPSCRAAKPAASVSTCRSAAISSRPPPTCSRHLRALDARRRRDHRRHADPARRASAKPSTTACARGRAAL